MISMPGYLRLAATSSGASARQGAHQACQKTSVTFLPEASTSARTSGRPAVSSSGARRSASGTTSPASRSVPCSAAAHAPRPRPTFTARKTRTRDLMMRSSAESEAEGVAEAREVPVQVVGAQRVVEVEVPVVRASRGQVEAYPEAMAVERAELGVLRAELGQVAGHGAEEVLLVVVGLGLGVEAIAHPRAQEIRDE